MTIERSYVFNDPEEVERHYKRTCKKLTEAEVNCAIFNKMVKSGVATNDVHNFVT